MSPSTKECKQCIAETKNHEQCKRLASCEINCPNFCWQHAKEFNGALEQGTCSEPIFPVCGKGQYPCRDSATNTILWNAEDEQSTYLSPGKGFRQHERPEYVKKFNLEWKNAKAKTRLFTAVVRTGKNQSKSFHKDQPLTNITPYNPAAKPKKSSIKHAARNKQ